MTKFGFDDKTILELEEQKSKIYGGSNLGPNNATSLFNPKNK